MRRLPVIAETPLPPLYDAWMREALGAAVPPEPESTCADCAMVAPPDQVGGHGFDPHAKCCTHLPFLPNFLAGRILADEAAGAAHRHGRASVRARIRERIAVSPIGLHAPEPRVMAERIAHEHGDFGRVRSLVCPHFIDRRGGLCGIWEHRNATCTTFFCKHSRGARGDRLWRAIELLLKRVEAALARHCLMALDFPVEAFARALARHDPPEGDPSRGAELASEPERHRQLWGAWEGREEALYLACAEIVAPLGWSEVLRIGGVEVEARARIARHLLAGMDPREAPEALRAGVFTGVEVGPERTRVATYSKLDPLDLPNALLGALGRFDGRSTRAVVREIAREDGLALDDELIAQLMDFEILVEADTPRRG